MENTERRRCARVWEQIIHVIIMPRGKDTSGIVAISCLLLLHWPPRSAEGSHYYFAGTPRADQLPEHGEGLEPSITRLGLIGLPSPAKSQSTYLALP